MRRRITFFLCAILVVLSWPASAGGASEAQAGALDRIVGRGGVYAFADPADLDLLKSIGGSMIVANYGTLPTTMKAALRDRGVAVLDATVKTKLYRAVCPEGPSSCRTLTKAQEDALIAEIKDHVRGAKASGQVVGYYILDDNYAAMASVLPRVYAAIRSIDGVTPTVCPFFMPLTGGTETAATALDVFQRSLRNYSPKWCNKVGIYAYVRRTRLSGIQTVDWKMSTTLPAALEMLRARGWTAAGGTLIGIPQAFGYGAQSADGGSLLGINLRATPTAVQLRAQVTAFCARGAKSIFGYAWSSRQSGMGAADLERTLALRNGYRDGLADCRRNYWGGS